MSRRPPNPAADRAAKNQATIKSLLKLEANKICADCKRNKHPRWASWNLGVFICIRCSGIHRGMGTHISRVKSVDLDSWTDEQLKSILSWGNARANKYWEAKLAAGHVPSESKIENFIRTKYELKRWVMDGGIPNPATLDVEADDDIPLSVVKEKQNVERRESIRKASVGKSAAPPKPAVSAVGDLLGGDIETPPVAPTRSTTGSAPPISRQPPPPKAATTPPKASVTKDSLLGLDFLGSETTAPPRPSSTTASQSRPDLKQSILSLYASAPRPQASHQPSGSLGGVPSTGTSQQQQQQNPMGGLQDAFSSLSFGSSNTAAAPAKAPPTTDPFSSFGSRSGSHQPTTSTSSFGALSGGNFFDTKSAAPATLSHQTQPSKSNFDPFSSFSAPVTSPKQTAAPMASKQTAAPTAAASGFGDLFDLSASSPAPAPAPIPVQASMASNSVFNLSATSKTATSLAQTTTTSASNSNKTGGSSLSGFSGADVWGGNEWSTPATEPVMTPVPKSSAPQSKPPSNDFGWGSSSLANTPIVPGVSGGFSTAPKVAQDEEFGGWTSSTGEASGNKSSGTGFGGNSEDLFSNVWQ